MITKTDLGVTGLSDALVPIILCLALTGPRIFFNPIDCGGGISESPSFHSYFVVDK